MNRRPGASSEKHTGFPRVTVRRLSPFTSRRQGSPPDRINLASQRHLLNHFKLVAELGGTVKQVSAEDIPQAIIATCREYHITAICMGHPAFKMPGAMFKILGYKQFLRVLSEMKIDLIIIA